jgi:hypothetical protein
MRKLFTKYITEEEFKLIDSAERKDRTHPFKYILESKDDNGFAYFNTEFAIKQVHMYNPDWIQKYKHKLLDMEDYSTSSAFLSEIRAYGYMLGAGLSVEPLSEPNPDFLVNNEDNESVEIEVFSKQYSKEQSEALEKFHRRKPVPLPNKHIAIEEHVVTPFNVPAPGENVTENVISKLTAIKQDEEQFSTSKPSILWIDFQDELWRLGSLSSSVFPLSTWNGEFFSGSIWYAFYGKKGLSIFESHALEERAIRSNVFMRHEGRFRMNSKVDAVLLSFPKSTFVLENPDAKNPLPEWFLKSMTMLRGFKFEKSWMNWPDKNLQKRINLEIERIETLKEAGMYSW